MNLFILLLIVILVIIYVWTNSKDYFTTGYDPSFLYQEPVNYNTREQNCNELTYSPTKCLVDTVVPSNKIVCNESLTPVTNNEKEYGIKDKKGKNNKSPTLSLTYDFDLLSSFNNSQINNVNNVNNVNDEKNVNNVNNENNNIFNGELESLDELKTDVRSLASIENDNITNY